MTDASIKRLKKALRAIALSTSRGLKDRQIEEELYEIRLVKKQIDNISSKKDRELILYCIDTLLEIREESNAQKLADFAKAIRGVPDIFQGNRNLYSLSDDFDAFKQKYGEEYFKSVEKIYPRFTKKAPKNALSFFSPTSDDAFKKKHPIGYPFLVILGIFAFMLPMIGVLVFTLVVDESRIVSGAWIVFMLAGAIIMGIGLFNIVAAIIHQYLGHKLTIICIFGGLALIGISVFLCIDTTMAQIFKPELVSFILVSLILCIATIIYSYSWFRLGVSHYLKASKKLNGSSESKLKRGGFFKNWLLYTEIHKKVNMGAIYYLNAIYVYLFLFNTAFTLTLGLIKPLSLVICATCVLMHLMCAIMSIFAKIQNNLEDHGKPIVFFAKRSNGGIDSIFFDLLILILPFLFAYLQIAVTGDLWGINLRFF